VPIDPPIVEYLAIGNIVFNDYDGFGYPVYDVDHAVNVYCMGGWLYWFSAQWDDHVFPPQGGRKEAMALTNCDSVIRSDYFGYYDWTPCGDLVGGPWDAAQTLWCGEPTATEATTWGAIKGLYR
jgi:hypothetical protein